ncbi:MAG: AmmeMemoRadiSam system protein A [Halarsenatibacteraceae bacterium]
MAENKLDLGFDPVKLARESLKDHFYNKGIDVEKPDGLEFRAGAFVSIKTKGDNALRGCIGTIEATRDDIYEEIVNNAYNAAFCDPRFPELQETELNNIIISVDIIMPAEKIDDLEVLDPEKYGVILERGKKRGLLLPDLDGVDTVKDQVSITARKAGISYNKILDEETNIYRFEVIRYKE